MMTTTTTTPTTAEEANTPPATPSPLSEQSFATAYQKGFPQTVRFLSSRGVPREAALDTAQAAWTKAWERREQLRNPSFLFTWVNSIALNVYRTLLRREKHTETLTEWEGPKQDLIAPRIDAERILQQCTPNDRIVLEAHYLRGFRLDEIAAQNHWSETAARIRLLRARKRVRQFLTTNQQKKRRQTHQSQQQPPTANWLEMAA